MEENKAKTKIVDIQFSPLGNRYEFFCPWEETKVGDFVVGRGELGESVGRVMKIRFTDHPQDAYSSLVRKATNNETYEGEEIFNLKHTVSREKKFIKANGEVVIRKLDENAEESGEHGDLAKLLSILRFVLIGIGILLFMSFKEEIFTMLGL